MVAQEPILLATGGYDHTIRLWQATSGVCLKTIQHPDSVSFISNDLLKYNLRIIIYLNYMYIFKNIFIKS